MRFDDDPDLHLELLSHLARHGVGLPPLDRPGRARWRAELEAVVREAQGLLDLDEADRVQFLADFERDGWAYAVALACHERGDPAPEGTRCGPPDGWPGTTAPPKLAP